jgi:hypothetical protein
MDWKNKLTEQYPSLFRTKGDRQSYCGFHVGEGWRPIIETLCAYLDHDRAKIAARIDDKDDNGVGIPPLEYELENTEWPVVAQIKEKFGTLRFYCHHTTTEQNYYIDFAESLTGRVCEDCGKPGTTGNGKGRRGWIKTLCDECRGDSV